LPAWAGEQDRIGQDRTLRTATLALVYSIAEYGAQVWRNSTHTKKIDTQLNSAMRIVSGTAKSTRTQ